MPWTPIAVLQSPPGQPDPFEPFLQPFFDNQPRTARGLGSGFIINPVGYPMWPAIPAGFNRSSSTS
jgi:hypothetical protein